MGKIKDLVTTKEELTRLGNELLAREYASLQNYNDTHNLGLLSARLVAIRLNEISLKLYLPDIWLVDEDKGIYKMETREFPGKVGHD